MKKKYIFFAAIAVLALTTSCESYLDKMPDDRAEVNTADKVQKLLVSAYSQNSPDFILEMSSDNVMDNGKQYTAQPNQDEAYRWQDIETTGNDDPKNLWNGAYTAIATANEALSALEELGDNPANNGMKAEALLCRAYGMFRLSNTFCMAYNPEHADDYLGLPYPKVPGESVDERGTLGELYANINADIEAALPLLNDGHLKEAQKYHFNTKAAYAFAARFNLFYLNYDKAIEYATKALGSNPASVLRKVSTYASLGGIDAISNAYISSSENANLLLLPAYSISGRANGASDFMRYETTYDLCSEEVFWANMPWGTGSGNNTLCASRLLYGNDQTVFYPKMQEVFEYTDKINGIGFTHIVDAVFTTDETLLVRAEAYALSNNTAKALEDMNTWMIGNCVAAYGTAVRPTLTEETLNKFFNALPEVPATLTDESQRGTKKPLHPQGFTVAAGTQTNLIYCILQMRRIETWQQGSRFLDIKRYGIEFSHNLDGEATITFKAGDPRGAIQLPSDVVNAGLQANPR